MTPAFSVPPAEVRRRAGGRPVGQSRGGREAGRSSARVPSPDRELVAAIRAELAAIEPPRACCREAERAGLGPAATGRAHSPAVARLAVRLATDDTQAGLYDWDTAAEHCRLAWLRGVFLAHGSLSVGFARTHLEFVVEAEAAAVLADRLRKLGLPAGVRLRRGLGVVTWKNSDRVASFLRMIGAGPALLELEARGVARTLRGELNRLLNAEAANLERAVEASARQLEAIHALEGDGRLAAERPAVRSVAAMRMATPDATLSEIALDLGVTRSSVQRALERLERLSLHPAAGDAPFGPGRGPDLPG